MKGFALAILHGTVGEGVNWPTPAHWDVALCPARHECRFWGQRQLRWPCDRRAAVTPQFRMRPGKVLPFQLPAAWKVMPIFKDTGKSV